MSYNNLSMPTEMFNGELPARAVQAGI